jgi:predicted small lipoprotein YifL
MRHAKLISVFRPASSMRRLVVVMLASALLPACGLKGPLYLPTPQQEREIAERKKRLEEREEREKQQQQASQTQQPAQQSKQPQPPQQ